MIKFNRPAAPVIEKTTYKSSNSHYSGNRGTKERTKSSIILRIICIIFCTILLFGGNNSCTSKDVKKLTKINESSYLYTCNEFHRMEHISIVTTEKGYDITYLQITEETTRNVKFNRFEEFTYVILDISSRIVIKKLLQLAVNLYNVTRSKRRKKRIPDK